MMVKKPFLADERAKAWHAKAYFAETAVLEAEAALEIAKEWAIEAKKRAEEAEEAKVAYWAAVSRDIAQAHAEETIAQ